MTEQAQGNEITFSEEQQKYVDKLVGRARISAREKAETDAQAQQSSAAEQAERTRLASESEWQKLAEHHEARVQALEPLEGQVAVFEALIKKMLRDRIKTLGEVAKSAVDALPEGLSLVEKLTWLNANEGLFVETNRPMGTPIKKRKLSTADKTPEDLGHRRLRM